VNAGEIDAQIGLGGGACLRRCGGGRHPV
jgi:hypothetical protein